MNKPKELDISSYNNEVVNTFNVDSICLLTPEQVLERIPVISEEQLTESRKTGVLCGLRAPKFIYLSGKAVYKSKSIANWIDGLREAHSFDGKTFYLHIDSINKCFDWDIESCKKY